MWVAISNALTLLVSIFFEMVEFAINTKWIDITFVVDKELPNGSRVQCKVCHSPPICFNICHAKTIYVHSTSFYMFHAYIYIHVHDYHESIEVCRESLDMISQCVANEVFKNPTIKNSTIVMATNKQLISSSPNYWNFVVGSNWFIQSGGDSMDNIMVLKEHFVLCPRHWVS